MYIYLYINVYIYPEPATSQPSMIQKYTPKYTKSIPQSIPRSAGEGPGLIQDVFRNLSGCSCLLLFVDIVHSCWYLLIFVYIYLYLLLFVTCCYLFIFVYIYLYLLRFVEISSAICSSLFICGDFFIFVAIC